MTEAAASARALLLTALAAQPAWSDVPVIVLTGGNPRAWANAEPPYVGARSWLARAHARHLA